MKEIFCKIFICFLLISVSLRNSTLCFASDMDDMPALYENKIVNENMKLNLIGQVGGPTKAIAVEGKYAYVGIGLRMVVLNVSKPTKIKQIGATKMLDGFVTGVAISKNRAYVTAEDAGLYIVNILKPSNPSVIGFYDSPGYPENVFVMKKYAYIADGWAGLQVVDISNSKKPREVGSLSTIGYAFDVVVAQNIAYVAAAGAGLKVVDIKDPKKPIEIGKYKTDGYAYGLALSNKKRIVYLADGWEGLRIIDVSNPYQPQSIASHKTPGWAFGVEVKGDIVYVADAFKGLSIIDVSNPSFPKAQGAYEFDGHAGRVSIAGNKAYVADKNNGLRIINISNKVAPTQIGFYNPLGHAVAVAVSGNFAYVAAYSLGLRVIDISDPAHPVEIGAYDTQSTAIGVAVSGNYVYVSTMHPPDIRAGLHVIDVSNPRHPTKVGFYKEKIGMQRDLVVSDGIAYIANEWGLELIDISSPKNPTLAGYIDLQGKEWKATHGVDVSGTLAYVVGEGGLYIIDVSKPAFPTLIRNLNGPKRYYYDVDVAEKKAYITGDSGCLVVIDVSDPLNPTQLGKYCDQILPENLTVVKGTAYVAFGSSGLYGIDIADPSNPILSFLCDTPVYAFASAVVGSYIYVADAEGGLLIIDKRKGQSGAIDQTWRKINPANTSPSDVTPNLKQMLRFRTRKTPRRHGGGRGKWQDSAPPRHRIAKEYSTNTYRKARTWVVASTNNSGSRTLRNCIKKAGPGDTITFDPAVFPPKSPATIALQGESLSLWYGNLTIDASNAGVILDGRALHEGRVGFYVDSDNNVIKGLQILDFPYGAISIVSGAKNNIIGGNRTRGNGPTGEGNVISRNAINGVSMEGIGTMYNIVIGNFIGLDATGTSKLGNGFDGVSIYNGASFNRIGSLIPGERNIISGNKNAGISIDTGNPTGNIILGNFIGTDVTGEKALGNEILGILLDFTSVNTIIKNNLISDNNRWGISILSRGSSYNSVIGNLIGTDASGMKALGNCSTGVSVGFDGANYNRIGGTSPGDRNVISGNTDGIALIGKDNLILGNFIGTNISGTEAINNSTGIFISHQTSHSFVGGMSPQEKNVISGARNAGIRVDGTERQFIIGNNIGIDANGNIPLPNKGYGIKIGNNSKSFIIYGNLISGKEGIQLDGNENVLKGNTFKKVKNALSISGDNNLIYQNKFIEKRRQAKDSGNNNNWDRDGTGNYWSNYKGSDANGDGIGDTPYYISPNGVDNYPLMSPSYELTVKIVPKESGKVTIIPEKSTYDFGENVRLEANPNKGHSFSSWSGDILPAEKKKNPLILTMNKDKFITANFIPSSSPFISVSKRFLNFGAVVKGVKTPDQKFRILSIRREALDWQITDNAEWLECSPFSGSGNALIKVSVNPSQLSFGTYTAIIYVKSNLANSFQAITVVLEVISASEAGEPFGEWDKPLESSSPLGGCLPFSGWALDRVGVESVKIYRLKVPAEGLFSPDEIFVGDAFLVEGARPDVESLYPHFPQCSRSGWGYNLISEVLPGDGFYTFIAKARSVSGEEVELRRRKIIIDNTSTFNPFGTLDFPKTGGLVSGSFYNVTGWGLSKGQSYISEVDLYIDSEYKKTLSLGFSRPGIKSLFTDYYDSDYHGYIATIDATSLSIDYHTAFLIAEDSEGRQAVFGSRYFYTANEMEGLRGSEQNVMQESIGILDGKIYGNKAEKRSLRELEHVDEEVTIKINELKNIAIRGFSEEDDHITYKALYRGGEHLPLGMSFDVKKGIISWLPIPGFKGEFPIDVLKFKKSILTEKKRIVFNIE